MKRGRVIKKVDHFERGRLLSGDAIGIDRIHDGEIVALAQVAHDAQRIVEVAFDRDDLCAVNESLQQFAGRDFSRRQNHCAPHSRSRRVSCGRRRRVSG